MLIAFDETQKYIGKIYKLSDFKLVKSIFLKDSSENSMSTARVIGLSDSKLYLYDWDKQIIFVYNIDSVLSQNASIKPLKKVTLNNKERSISISVVDENKIIELNANVENQKKQLNFYDSNGSLIKSTVDFPDYDHYYLQRELSELFLGGLAYNYSSNNIVKIYYATDLIDLMDQEGKLIKRIQGPDNFDPQFKRVSEGNLEYLTFTKKSKIGYSGTPQIINKSIYTLYSGNSNPETIDGSHMFKFSESLLPLKHYYLTEPIYKFRYSQNGNSILGISSKRKRQVVRYSLNKSDI